MTLGVMWCFGPACESVMWCFGLACEKVALLAIKFALMFESWGYAFLGAAGVLEYITWRHCTENRA